VTNAGYFLEGMVAVVAVMVAVLPFVFIADLYRKYVRRSL